MKIELDKPEFGGIILVHADKRLDLTAYDGFGEAARLAGKRPRSRAIVVDLAKTRQLFDSGKAMLLTLRQRAGRLKNRIYLANATPEVRRKLKQGKFPKMFHIVHDAASVLHRAH